VTKNWVRTGNFYDVPRRDLPVNPYAHYQSKLAQANFDGAYTVDSSGVKSYLSGYEPGPLYTGHDINTEWQSYLSASDVYDVSADAGALLHEKLLKRLADTKVSTGLLAAEAKKTAGTVNSACERLYSALTAFKRGRFKAVAEILSLKRGTAHKNWLEYKYGWMPILMDVKGTAEFFAQQIEFGGRPPVQKISVSHDIERSYLDEMPVQKWGGSASDTYINTKSFVWTQHRTLAAWIVVTSQSLTAAQQAGLTNPALVAWELVPYSFVFDWFVSVGGYLEALTATQGLEIKKTMDSAVNTYEYTRIDPATSVVNGSTTWVNSQYYVHAATRSYNRASNLSTTPSLPKLRNPFPDIPKLVTSLALIRGKFR
jgi:hypothetical protein